VASDGAVALGPLRVQAESAVASGPVKVAVRPEAWRVSSPGTAGLAGKVAKHAYLGSFQELTVDTELGSIFVVCTDAARRWRVGEGVTLQLPARGVSVVAAGGT
jgi:iron(III) transport system ATP-binding protein